MCKQEWGSEPEVVGKCCLRLRCLDSWSSAHSLTPHSLLSVGF